MYSCVVILFLPSCENSILNFKINRDPNDGKYFVTPKKKFSTVKELLEVHQKFPLKSKARAGAKIYLLHPITKTDIQMILEMVKQKQESNQSMLSPPSPRPEPLPHPWKEYFDKNHQRPYFYNPETKQTLWDRPKGESAQQKRIQKSNTLDNRTSRPLPNVPEESSFIKPRHSLDTEALTRQGTSPRVDKRQRALPQLPPKSPSTPRRECSLDSGTKSPSTPRRDISLDSGMQVPQLPPKDPNNFSPTHHRGSLPDLPPKHVDHRPSLPLPSKDANLPPLPSKGTTNVPKLPEKVPSLPKKDPISPLNVPELPSKDISGKNGYKSQASSNAFLPPLPRKDSSPLSLPNPTISLPPLPPKDPSSPSDNIPNSSLPPRSRREYEETIILTPNTRRAVHNPLPPPINISSDIPPPPPVPSQGGPPPPPPAPPIGN